ncbi:MAG: DNA polymerase III subunit epsilon, partial [Morganella morganii]
TRPQSGLRVVYATDEEIAAHEARLDLAEKKGANPCIWRS